MWAALFFPLGLDEVAHNSGHGKRQTNLIPPHLTYPPMRKNARKHVQQRRFNLSPHGGHLRDGSDASAEEKESCGQHSFSRWYMISDMERDKPRRINPTPPHLTSPFLLCGKLLESTFNSPDSTYVRTAVTYLHWKARTSRGCCDTDEAKVEDIM